jgi:hypothetical protein
MARDWKLIAEGIAPEVPEPERERAVAVLQALEEQFAPLLQRLPHLTEPATIFIPVSQGSEELA